MGRTMLTMRTHEMRHHAELGLHAHRLIVGLICATLLVGCASDRPAPVAIQATPRNPNSPAPNTVGANCQAAMPSSPVTMNGRGTWLIANNSCSTVSVFLSPSDGVIGSTAIATIQPGQIGAADLGNTRGCIGPTAATAAICVSGYSTAQRAPVFLYTTPVAPNIADPARSSVNQQQFMGPKFQIRTSADVVGIRG